MDGKDINKGSWILCEKCKKGLLRRLPNGLLHFVFGKSRDKDGKLLGRSPVDIYIFGSIRMTCFRKDCGHVNIINYFPSFPIKNEDMKDFNQPSAEPSNQ